MCIRDRCIQLQVIRECGCFYSGSKNPSLNNIRPCLNRADYDCFYGVYIQFDPVKCAFDFCPLECHSIHYDLSVSSFVSSTIDEYDSLNISSSISYEEWRTKTLHINVYYSQLEYTLIQETPAMTLTSLIANLGGTLGLIVSLSFFTIVEIIEFFLLLLNLCFRKI